MRTRYKPRLLPRNRLVVTGTLDRAAWNYAPLLAPLSRARFRLIDQLIAGRSYGTILEIGYGSGIFMPDLGARCTRLLGVDLHPFTAEVSSALAAEGVSASLFTGSAEALPLENASVDLIVSISALEFVSDHAAAVREVQRVLRPGGQLALVKPLAYGLLDAALKVVTGVDAALYGEGRQALMRALAEPFSIVRHVQFPTWLPGRLRMYEGFLLEVRRT